MATIGQLILLADGTQMPTSSEVLVWPDGTQHIYPAFLPCDGRAVKQSDYPALYNVIGGRWGEPNPGEFCLPSGLPSPPGLEPPANYFICTQGTDPTLPAPDSVLGRVDRFAFQPTVPTPEWWTRPASQQTIPSNYHPCDGSSLQVSQNTPLFSLLENHYGGDYPVNTFFNLPNVPTDPSFFGGPSSWGMPHEGYCIVSGYGIYPAMPYPAAEDDFAGQIILMPTPWGTPAFPGDYGLVLPCNGGSLRIADYDLLFDIIGTTYGGDGQETFALPKLTPPPGLEHHTYFIVASGIFPASYG